MPDRSEIAVVTGGARGIGAAIVERLACPNRIVFLNYRNSRQEADQLRERLATAGGRVETVCADIADRDAVQSMFNRISQENGRLDILVHNAAAPLEPKRLNKLDWEHDVMPQLSVACLGFLNCVQAARPMLGEGSRVIVLLTDALFHKPPVQMGAYLAAKGALWGLARAAAKELQPRGIAVNMVSPAMTGAGLLRNYPDRALEVFAEDHPMRRLARPEEVAAAVAALADGAGGYMHGANVILNGGSDF